MVLVLQGGKVSIVDRSEFVDPLSSLRWEILLKHCINSRKIVKESHRKIKAANGSDKEMCGC